MSSLPKSYAAPWHLPFNRSTMRQRLQEATPDADPGGPGCWVLLRGNDLLVPAGGSPVLPEGDLAGLFPHLDREPLYVGSWDGRPCRALPASRNQPIPAGLRAESLLATNPCLDLPLLSLGGFAGQALHWEKNSRFCSRCGAGMDRIPGAWGKRCRGCGYAHFPHIHPCIIVLVRRPGEVLLTRKANWPEGRYSLVAGFVEFGECLEECVQREVLEETGVAVDRVRYVGSQAWPFPSQLMAGFVAEYGGGEVRVAEDELEDVHWFPVDRLPQLPPKRSIARYLLDNHLSGD